MDKSIIECFDNIYGYESTKQELYTLACAFKNSDKCKALGINVPRGVIFYGEPGLGKTTMAKDLLEASGRYSLVFRKKKSQGFAKALEEVFSLAKKNQPSIILLDDMDKYSNTDEDHQNTDEFISVQTCIDDLKKDDVVVVATANDDDCFPDSLLRAGRFDRKIYIQTPTVKEATEILQRYLAKANVTDDIDTNAIARLMTGKSCAALESIINEAGIYAVARDQKQIDMKCMIDACLSIFYHVPETLDKEISQERYDLALHEAGHAVLHELLFPGSTALVSTRISNKAREGITIFDVASERTFEDSKAIIMCGLAGRAASEIKFGIPDLGSEKDLRTVIEKASDLICSQGYIGIKKTEMIDLYSSDFSKTQIYVEVNLLIGELYQKTKKMLLDNFAIVEKVANELVEKDTLLGKDVRKIVEASLREAS